MKAIIRNRDSGKAYELLEYASRVEAIVLTSNKAALQVKANAYGFDNLTIIDYEDLENGNYYYGQPLVIHNSDKLLQKIFADKYGLWLIGYSATLEDESDA